MHKNSELILSNVRYESHYALPLGRKKGAKLSEADEKILSQKRSSKTDKKYKERQKDAKVDQALNDQFLTGMQNMKWLNFAVKTSVIKSPTYCLQKSPGFFIYDMGGGDE